MKFLKGVASTWLFPPFIWNKIFGTKTKISDYIDYTDYTDFFKLDEKVSGKKNEKSETFSYETLSDSLSILCSHSSGFDGLSLRRRVCQK